MIIEEQPPSPQPAPAPTKLSWVRIVLVVLILLATGWFMLRVDWSEVGHALASAKPLPIAAGVGFIVLTGVIKSWRWQRLFFPPDKRPTFRNSFNAWMLNQFVNNVVPGRFGELARAHNINNSSNVKHVEALSTIVVEKGLDMLFLMVSLVLLLPWAILPSDVTTATNTLAVTAVTLIVLLYLFAFQTERIVQLVEWFARFLPVALGQRMVSLATSGLQGLAALRDRRANLEQLVLSTIIAILHFMTPFVLFAAFDLPFNFIHAAVLHLGVSVVSAPPSTPGKIGVFELFVVALLQRLDPSLPESVLLSYTLVFHLVAFVPPIIIGAIAAARSDWGWRRTT